MKEIVEEPSRDIRVSGSARKQQRAATTAASLRVALSAAPLATQSAGGKLVYVSRTPVGERGIAHRACAFGAKEEINRGELFAAIEFLSRRSRGSTALLPHDGKAGIEDSRVLDKPRESACGRKLPAAGSGWIARTTASVSLARDWRN